MLPEPAPSEPGPTLRESELTPQEHSPPQAGTRTSLLQRWLSPRRQSRVSGGRQQGGARKRVPAERPMGAAGQEAVRGGPAKVEAAKAEAAGRGSWAAQGRAPSWRAARRVPSGFLG